MRVRQVFCLLLIVILSVGCTIILFRVFRDNHHEQNARFIALNDSIALHFKDTLQLYPLLGELEHMPVASQKHVLLMLRTSGALDSVGQNARWSTIKRFIKIYKRNIVLTSGMEQLDLQMGLLELCKSSCEREDWDGGWNLIMDIASNPLLTGEQLARYQLIVSRKLSLEESFKMLEESISYYSKSGNKRAYIDALRSYIIDCLKAGDYDRALEYCTKS